MSYKIIALDLDGTLLTEKKEILPKTKKSLINAQKNGLKVVLASGRPITGMEYVAKELELYKYGGYILSYNGGQIFDCSKGKDIFSKTIAVEDMKQIYDLSVLHNTNILTYLDNKVYAEFYDEWIEIEIRINKMKYVETDNLLETVTKPVPKFIMLASGDYIEKIEPLISSQLEDKFSVTRSEPFFLEIMPKGIDKATTLEKLGELINIKQEEIIACGDSYNDITMIKYAGLGVAMSNAKQEVKDIADFVTLSNEENGIAHVIEKYIS